MRLQIDLYQASTRHNPVGGIAEIALSWTQLTRATRRRNQIMKRWAATIALLLLLPVLLTHAQGNNTYTVQSGDTLFSIANKFGVSVDDLAHANNIAAPTSIVPGQQLIIPVIAQLATPAATQAAAAPSDAQPTATATSVPATAAPPATYTVVAGDDLNQIAARFHTTVGAIMPL